MGGGGIFDLQTQLVDNFWVCRNKEEIAEEKHKRGQYIGTEKNHAGPIPPELYKHVCLIVLMFTYKPYTQQCRGEGGGGRGRREYTKTLGEGEKEEQRGGWGRDGVMVEVLLRIWYSLFVHFFFSVVFICLLIYLFCVFCLLVYLPLI